MSKPDLKRLAEDLEGLLAAPAPKAPVVDESYLIAAEPVAPVESVDNDHLIPQLVRSVVEYAITRVPTGSTPRNIGGAITAGIEEAIKQLDLDRAKVVEAVNEFMSELAESIDDSLTG